MILTCPGMFSGELIVALDSSHKNTYFVMKSTNGDLEIFKTVFHSLVSTSFPQCINQPINLFCFFVVTQHLRLWLQRNSTVSKVHWGFTSQFPYLQCNWNYFWQCKGNALFVVMCDLFFSFFIYFNAQYCSSKEFQHLANIVPNTTIQLAHTLICWTHNQSIHHFFINYRVSSEGRKSPSSQAVLQIQICRNKTEANIKRYECANEVSPLQWRNVADENREPKTTKAITIFYPVFVTLFPLIIFLTSSFNSDRC